MGLEEEEFSLEEQVFWCIRNLENKLQIKNISPKEAKSLMQSLKILGNEKTSLVKKRQVMRITCGDYRAAMQEEMKSLRKQMKKYRITPIEKHQGSRFLQKSVGSCQKEETKEEPHSVFTFNFPEIDEEQK